MKLSQHGNRGMKFLDRRLTNGRVQRALALRKEEDVRRSLGLTYEAAYWYQRSASRELKELFDAYGSDKGTNGSASTPYPWPAHSYADVYASLFGHCRDAVTAVFECGIGTNYEDTESNMTRQGKPGASLRAWRDYFPNAAIVGADVDSRILFQDVRIRTYQVDQANADSVRALWTQIEPSKFDLMIDDGLHTFSAGTCLLEASLGHLKPGGLYVIEDVGPTDLARYRDYFQDQNLWVTFVVMPRTPREPIGDNSMIILRTA